MISSRAFGSEILKRVCTRVKEDADEKSEKLPLSETEITRQIGPPVLIMLDPRSFCESLLRF